MLSNSRDAVMNQSTNNIEDSNPVIKKNMLQKVGLSFINLHITISRKLDQYLTWKPHEVERYGRTFLVSGNLEYFFFWRYKSWERNTYRIFDTFIDKHHSYIDIGAFIGSTVLYGAQISKKTYALEPDPIAFRELKKNVELNTDFKERIEIYRQCINDYTGEVRFGNMGCGGDTMSGLRFADSKTSWTVDGITFDDFIKDHHITDCNFIKMDIEGGEVTVLPTMKQYLQDHKPVLYLSMHPPFFEHATENTKKIMTILDIYKNIYDDDGSKIDIQDMLSVNKLKKFYAIVATDNDWKVEKD